MVFSGSYFFLQQMMSFSRSASLFFRITVFSYSNFCPDLLGEIDGVARLLDGGERDFDDVARSHGNVQMGLGLDRVDRRLILRVQLDVDRLALEHNKFVLISKRYEDKSSHFSMSEKGPRQNC